MIWMKQKSIKENKIIDYFIIKGDCSLLLSFLDYCNDFQSSNNELSQKYIVDKLIEYGFEKKENYYTYQKDILNKQFKVIIKYKNNKISGKIIDKEINEELLNYRVKNYVGDFINKVKDENGNKLYINLSNYGIEGERESSWFVDNVKKYHRTFSTIINTLIETGFKIEKIIEPLPTEELLKNFPEYKDLFHKPDFLLVKVSK